MKRQLIIDVEYDDAENLSEDEKRHLDRNLELIAHHAANVGMFTNGSEATVGEWDFQIVKVEG